MATWCLKETMARRLEGQPHAFKGADMRWPLADISGTMQVCDNVWKKRGDGGAQAG